MRRGAILLLAVLAVVIAGCGSDDSGTASSNAAAAQQPAGDASTRQARPGPGARHADPLHRSEVPAAVVRGQGREATGEHEVRRERADRRRRSRATTPTPASSWRRRSASSRASSRPSWTEVTAGNWGDRWDLAYGSGAIDFDRMKRALYMTQPYYSTPQRTSSCRSPRRPQTPADLAGKKIGACAGCTMEKYLRGTLKLPGAEARRARGRSEDRHLRHRDARARGDRQGQARRVPLLRAGRRRRRSGRRGAAALAGPAYYSYKTGYVDKKSGLDRRAVRRAVDEIVAALPRRRHAEAPVDQVLRQGLRDAGGAASTCRQIKQTRAVRRSGARSRGLMARLVLTFLALSLLMVAIVGVGVVHRERATRSRRRSSTASAPRRAAQGGLRSTAGSTSSAATSCSSPGCSEGSKPGTRAGSGATSARCFAASAAARRRARAFESVLRYVVSQTADAQELLVLDLDGRVVVSTVPATSAQARRKRGVLRPGQLRDPRAAPRPVVAHRQADDHRRDAAVRPRRPADRRRRGEPQPRAARPHRAARHAGLGTTGASYLVGKDRHFVHARPGQRRARERRLVAAGSTARWRGGDGRGALHAATRACP